MSRFLQIARPKVWHQLKVLKPDLVNTRRRLMATSSGSSGKPPKKEYTKGEKYTIDALKGLVVLIPGVLLGYQLKLHNVFDGKNGGGKDGGDIFSPGKKESTEENGGDKNGEAGKEGGKDGNGDGKNGNGDEQKEDADAKKEDGAEKNGNGNGKDGSDDGTKPPGTELIASLTGDNSGNESTEPTKPTKPWWKFWCRWCKEDEKENGENKNGETPNSNGKDK